MAARVCRSRRRPGRTSAPRRRAVEEWVFTCVGRRTGPSGSSPATAIAGGRSGVVLGGARRVPDAPCCTSPTGTSRAGRSAARQGRGLWAEHVCDAPMEQWTVANETYAAALDDPDEALGRAYGARRRWPSTSSGTPRAPVAGRGRRLRAGRRRPRPDRARPARPAPSNSTTPPPTAGTAGAPDSGRVALPDAYAHTGLRAPFAFPDGTVADWVLTPDGWRSRARRASESSPVPGRLADRSPFRLVRRRRAGADSVRRHGTGRRTRAGPAARRRRPTQAQAVPDRPVLDRRRQEVRDGDHGLIGVGYVVGHMIGNLKMFFGPERHRPLRRVAPRAARAGAAAHRTPVADAPRAHRRRWSSTCTPPTR